MTSTHVYSLAGVLILCLGLYSLIVDRHLVRKLVAVNILGSAVFLVMVALADRRVEPPIDPDARSVRVNSPARPDPVPHAMVLTGIVVAVSSTALALALVARLYQRTGATSLFEKSA